MKINTVKIEGDHNIVIQNQDGMSETLNLDNLKNISNFFNTYPDILPDLKVHLENFSEINNKVNELIQLLTYKLNSPKIPEKSLELVDIVIVKEEGNNLPLLEIKVINNSEFPIFIKEIEFETLGYWEIRKDMRYSLISVSYTYDFELPLIGTSKSLKISQGVSPYSFDRFQIRLKGSYNGVISGLSPYLIKFKLIYNSTNDFIISPDILLHIQNADISFAAGYFSGWSPQAIKNNKSAAMSILKCINEYTIINPNLLSSIQSWQNAPD